MTTKNKSPKICPECNKKHLIFHKEICLRCHERNLTATRLKLLRKNSEFKTEYNRYIFKLFLDYVENCVLRSGLANQAEKLYKILKVDDIQSIRTWAHIDSLSAKYQLWDNNYRQAGCAFKKIGRMLQELGAIGHSEEEGSNLRAITKLESSLFSSNFNWWQSFFLTQQKKRLTHRTYINILYHIINCQNWLQENTGSGDLASLSQRNLEKYLLTLRENYSSNQVYCRFCNLRRFYKYGVQEKFCIQNPFINFECKRPSSSLNRLSDKSISILFRYISNEKSCPENALLIALPLCYALTKEDMIHAQLQPISKKNEFNLLLRTKTKSAGRHRQYRDRVLCFKSSPGWFKKLLSRYKKYWDSEIAKKKTQFGRKPFLLPRNNQLAVPLNSKVVDRKLVAASKKALNGKSVSFTLLRNTCGYIHTKQDDASILTKLGWSKKHAFSFIYRDQKIIK